MNTARLIIPADVDRFTVDTAEGALINEFGGFTMTRGIGAWSHNGAVIREEIRVYDVAIVGPCAVQYRHRQSIMLRSIAQRVQARSEPHQECIYVCDFFGNVTLESTSGAPRRKGDYLPVELEAGKPIQKIPGPNTAERLTYDYIKNRHRMEYVA